MTQPTDQQTAREQAWSRFPADAETILGPAESRSGRCRQTMCGAPVWWGVTAANGRRCPFDIKPDGTRTATSHWRTCRDRPSRRAAP